MSAHPSVRRSACPPGVGLPARPFVYPSFRSSMHLSFRQKNPIRPSVRPSVRPGNPSIRQPISVRVRLSVCPPIRPSVRRSACPPVVRLSARPFADPFVDPSVRPSEAVMKFSSSVNYPDSCRCTRGPHVSLRNRLAPANSFLFYFRAYVFNQKT